MIPYDVDPSLHSSEPEAPSLEDGFSPPNETRPEAREAAAAQPIDPALWNKSAF
jgi:hypothetical protein